MNFLWASGWLMSMAQKSVLRTVSLSSLTCKGFLQTPVARLLGLFSVSAIDYTKVFSRRLLRMSTPGFAQIREVAVG